MSRTIRGALVCVLAASGWLAADDQYFESAGVHLRYVVAGKGEPVVLIHGFAVPDLETMWIKNAFASPAILPELAKDRLVIAFDCRGHGKSDKPHKTEAYGKEMVDDVARLMDHLRIQKAHVVGYSMGSMVGLSLLARHPGRLLSMTLGGGGGVFKPDVQFLTVANELTASLEKNQGIGPLLIAIAPPDKPKPTPVQAALTSAMILANQDQKALACVIRGLKELEVPEAKLRANAVPTLVIVGTKDAAAIRTVDRIRGVLASATFESVEAGDHVSTLSIPAFRHKIRAFIAANSLAAKQ